MTNLEKLYSEAKQELTAKHFDQASILLKEILQQDENYKDASRLLAQIIQHKRRRWYTHPLFYAGIALIVLMIVGILVLPGIIAKFRARNSTPPLFVATPQITITPETIMPTPTASSTEALLPFRWVRINNGQEFPRDATVALVADPVDADVVYVGTRNAGVYKTINGGESWQPANNGIESMELKNLVIDPSNPKTLYLHSGHYLYKTSNGALTWEKLKNIETFVMDPKDSRHLYAASETVSETLNGGETWSSPAGAGRCGEGVTKMLVDWLDSNVLYAACSNGVYVSVNKGGTWQLLKRFNQTYDLAVTLLPDGQVAVLEAGSDPEGLGFLWLYKTAESKWVVKERACGMFAVDPNNPSSIYCEQYHSKDGGLTWPQITGYDYWYVNNMSLLTVIGGKKPAVYIARDEGPIFYSTDEGSTFSAVSLNGLPGVGYELTISPANDSVMTLVQKDCDWNCTNFIISVDGGTKWHQVNKGIGNIKVAFDADGSTIYTFANNSYENQVPLLLTSKDTGGNWYGQVIADVKSSIVGIWSSPIQSGALVLYLDYPEFRLMRTVDGGKTWEKVLGSYQLDKSFQFIGVGSRVYTFNGIKSTIVYSEDLFSTTHSCGFLITPPLLIKPAFSHLPDSKVVIYTMGSSGIVRSMDQCEHWDPLPSQPANTDIHSLAADLNDPDIVYVGTNDGVYITVDAGEHWGLVTEGLLGANLIYSLGVDSKGTVLAVTPYGIFKLEEK